MQASRLQTANLPVLFLFLPLLLVLIACSDSAIPTPDVTPQAGPSWAQQQAIEMIPEVPLSFGDQACNADFDWYLGRWKVTLVYDVRKLYPPRDERQTLLWYVYEDTGEV